MSQLRLVLILLVATMRASSLFAHDPGLSTAHIERNNGDLKVTLTFAWTDLSPLIPGSNGTERPAPAELAKLGPGLSTVSAGLVRLSSGATDVPVSVVAGTTSDNEVLVSKKWSQIDPGQVMLEFPILAKLPFGHRMIVLMGESNDALALLDKQHASWEVPAIATDAAAERRAPAANQSARWPAFLQLGVEHILTGFDHLCFLLALLLVAVRLRDILGVVTTFTIAHSITLAAAATGLVSLSPRIVEPLIAVSIIYIAVENLFLTKPPRHRLAVVFGFGLIHGLGFATALADRLPGVTGFAILPPLLAFNGGVELGQLAVAACLVPLLVLARRRPAIAARLQPVFSVMIAVAGIVWFCQRV
ncbi:MAG: HupE/UreJ family protein [Opitutus sp.]